MEFITLLLGAARARHLVVPDPQSALYRPNAIADRRVRFGGQSDLRIFRAFGRRLWGASIGDRGGGVAGEGVRVKGSAGILHRGGGGRRESCSDSPSSPSGIRREMGYNL